MKETRLASWPGGYGLIEYTDIIRVRAYELSNPSSA